MKEVNNMGNIILGTGNYDNVNSGNRVSITGDGGHEWKFYGNAYIKLAPRLKTYIDYASQLKDLEILEKNPYKINEYEEFRKKIEDEYIYSYYETRLKNLDVFKLLETLKNLFGEEIILLCHESIDKFCHRRLVADYIELETGIYIPEVSVDKSGNVKKLTPIRYLDRLKKLKDN